MSWLAALIHDPRFRLFFTDEELKTLSESLKGFEPLYQQENFYYYDRFCDGDSYASPSYREHFQAILKALREHHILFIGYEGKKESAIPLKSPPISSSTPPRMTNSVSAVCSTDGDAAA